MAGNKLGSEWTYCDFVSNIDKHNIEAATIIDKSNAIAVIDGNHGETIMGDNIHFIKTIPETTDLIIDKLTHSNINFDVFVHQSTLYLIFLSVFS